MQAMALFPGLFLRSLPLLGLGILQALAQRLAQPLLGRAGCGAVQWQLRTQPQRAGSRTRASTLMSTRPHSTTPG